MALANTEDLEIYVDKVFENFEKELSNKFTKWSNLVDILDIEKEFKKEFKKKIIYT